jgi:hypothetical protein
MGHAVIIASKLAGDDDWEGYVVSVSDDGGNEIARVPIHHRLAAVVFWLPRFAASRRISS